MSKQPNIVMIMTDQQRFDTLGAVAPGAFGLKESLTPNLDRVAAESTVFTNAYTPSPVCAPARASIKTGMYPPGCGMTTNWIEFKKTELHFLPQVLQDNGYDTGLVGKLHFMPADGNFGFRFRCLHDAPYSVYADDDKNSEYIAWLKEKYFDEKGVDPVALFDDDESAYDSDIAKFIAGSGFRSEEEHDVPWITANSQKFLSEQTPDRPYFLFASYFGPHQPYLAPEPWASMYDPDSIELPDNYEETMDNCPVFQALLAGQAKRLRSTLTRKDYQRLLAYNFGQISMIDHYIGKLLDTIRERGEWDNTVICFLSDHGDHLGSYGVFFKGQMYDSCCKVPLMLKVPGIEPKVCDKNVNTMDTYCTLLDLAGVSDYKSFPNIEARSLVDLLHGDSTNWNNETYSIIGNFAEKSNAMLKKDHYKLNRLAQGENPALYEMFDLEKDPLETVNVWDDPAYTAIRDEMKAKLDQFHTEQQSRYPKPEEIVSHIKH